MKGLLAFVLACLLAGCAVPGNTALGTPRAEVLAQMGPPTATYAMPGGERLQYSTQPMGHEVYNLDLDARGRVAGVQQAMETAVFDRIVPGTWNRQDVLQSFGKPALVEKVARFDGDIWTYRYLDFYTPWMLHISLDPGGVVRAVQRFEEFPVRGADGGSFP